MMDENVISNEKSTDPTKDMCYVDNYEDGTTIVTDLAENEAIVLPAVNDDGTEARAKKAYASGVFVGAAAVLSAFAVIKTVDVVIKKMTIRKYNKIREKIRDIENPEVDDTDFTEKDD